MAKPRPQYRLPPKTICRWFRDTPVTLTVRDNGLTYRLVKARLAGTYVACDYERN